ncbi:DMT family transporter [Streptomyces sp. NPDC057717]|uniref:DMT family transporter n=1 Tax=Streptomyces sp. NPDC057717 TaxID=3346224 RepID=UPI0036944339
MYWLYLTIATVFEVAFALAANAAKGFTRLWPSLLTLATSAGGIYFLSLALIKLDVAVGYTIWVGGGSVGAITLGALLYRERISMQRVVCFGAIIAGVIGLRFTAG